MAPKLSQRLDIDSLRALCAIEEQGGVTRAARFIGLSQSAISHKVKRLESSLDCALLSRRPGAPLFTDAGQDLLAYARRILGIHDEALLSLSKTPLSGKISLGMTEDMTCSDLSRILGRFKRLYPGVSVRAQVHQSLTLRSMLAKGALDLAVMQVFKDEIRPSDVLMSDERLHWVAAADFKLEPGRPIPFLSFDQNCFYRRWAFDIGQEKGLVFETVLECASAAGIVAGICAGLGVALLDEHHLRPEMQILKRPFPAPPPIAYVVRVGRKTRNKAVEALVKEIANETVRHAALRVA
jgi:DNA-binding transcriptional LysR family regulator